MRGYMSDPGTGDNGIAFREISQLDYSLLSFAVLETKIRQEGPPTAPIYKALTLRL